MSNFAMIFPGQGSQFMGMLANLAKEFAVVEETFEESSNVLGYSLWDLIQNGSEEELNKTWKTQPALLSASVAIFRVWKENKGKIPKLMAGHSLGEYSALVCADVIDFKSAVKLVELRGKFMQEAVPAGIGAMYAIIGLDNQSVLASCQQAAQGQIVSAVNFNSPGQIVIAGEKNAVKRAVALCKATGAKLTLPLAVSVPSHCALMQPAAKKLAQVLEAVVFNKPNIAVVNNVDVKIENSVESIRHALIKQLYKPVRWVETIEFIAKQGIVQLLEIGPGQVLTGLNKRIVSTINSAAINDTKSLITALINN
ncbi:Malonyl CoA-acyl carrier protein transacylase [Arsenophonus endosymbiont of Aleurodicus dispersus]|uniref:ACP S-malonyltransferase n=1 Tax=Arsenophonus endosymbiont of Aleurodicus dispersus TaxID=235559 RepID=UPI000EAF11C9|nr:ACP S-malonyltransferase [Arsenophonus endosymbiont of Aleurodicus dispersus]VAY02459.1 Malonyl CoA-acyl carrier protein transacylase [Arsenophonus endosymbiont of Aleurodicus dispersus]